jgi:hypothetical protein
VQAPIAISHPCPPLLPCPYFIASPSRLQSSSASSSSSSSTPAAEAEAEAAAAAAPEADGEQGQGSYPGDFAVREDEKGFAIHPMEGVNLLLQSTLGQGGGPPAAVAAQVAVNAGGAQTMWIVSDQKGPSMQAVLQPGPDGKILKLATSARPVSLPRIGAIRGLSAEAETLVSSSAVRGTKLTLKYGDPSGGGDSFTSLTVQPWGGMGGAPPNFELNYHQTLAEDASLGTVTGGGTFSGVLDTDSAGSSIPIPIPTIKRVLWGTFWSWESRRRATWVGTRIGPQPRADGSTVQNATTHVWHRVARGLELGTDLSVSMHSLTEPSESVVGVGGRMQFDAPGGLGATLTGHLNSQLVTSVQWVKPHASPVSSTFARTTLVGVFDHANKDYKLGMQMEVYY